MYDQSLTEIRSGDRFRFRDLDGTTDHAERIVLVLNLSVSGNLGCVLFVDGREVGTSLSVPYDRALFLIERRHWTPTGVEVHAAKEEFPSLRRLDEDVHPVDRVAAIPPGMPVVHSGVPAGYEQTEPGR